MTKNTKKILLIEDQYISRAPVISIIKQFEYEVDVAVSGKEVLELVQQNLYDLIYMDLGLPDIDGIRLTKMIRAEGGRNKDVPIIALTAHGDEGIKAQATQVGMNGFILKLMTKESCEQALSQFVLK